MTVHEHLRKIRACEEAREWAAQFHTAQEVWENCDRADWLLWWAGHTGDNLYGIRKVAKSIADSVQYLRSTRCDAAAYAAYAADAAYAAYAAADAAYAAADAADDAADAAASPLRRHSAAARKDQQQLNMAICRKWLVCPWHE